MVSNREEVKIKLCVKIKRNYRLQSSDPSKVRKVSLKSYQRRNENAFYLNNNIVLCVICVSLSIKPQRCNAILFPGVGQNQILLRVLWGLYLPIGEIILTEKDR